MLVRTDPARLYGKNLTNSIPCKGMLSNIDDLDSESDVDSMTASVRRPVIIPESDNRYHSSYRSDENNVPLANFINNKDKVGRHRKAPTEKIKWKSN